MTKLYKLIALILYMPFVACMGSSHACAKTTLTHIDKEIADDLCSVAVHYNGRICPLNTPATEFLAKLCGKSSWQGLSANEVFVSWMIYYTEMDRLTQCILVNDVKGAKELVAKIRLYQREKADCEMPSELTLRMEMSYNRLQQAHWLVYLFLTLSFALCMLSLVKGASRRLKLVQYVFVLVAMHWLIVYTIPLFRRLIPFTPWWHNLYILLSFLSVLMTYFGANYFIPDMHSYA